MEEDDKNAEAAKMIGTSATEHQKEDDDILPLDSSFLNQLNLNEKPSQTEAETSSKKRKREGVDVAMNNSSTFPLPLPLPFDSSPNLTPKKRKEGPSLTTSSETPTKRRRRPPGSSSGSGSKKRKEGPSETTSTETPTKRRPGRPFGSRSAKFTPHKIELNAGQDVVDIIYNISVTNPRKTVTILSAFGSASDVFDLTPNGCIHRKGEFEIHSMSIKCLVDDDGRRCRKKAMCIVTFIDDKGNLFANTSVSSLIVARRVNITVALFNTGTAKKTGARISESAAPNDEIIPIAAIPLQMIPAREYGSNVMKEEGCTSGFLPTTSGGDGNIINPTSATTSASNDLDMKSPSVEDT